MTERRQVLTLALLAGVIVCWGFLGPGTSTPPARARARESSVKAPVHGRSVTVAVSADVTSQEVQSVGREENEPAEQPPGPVAPLPRAAALAAMERVPVQVQVTAGADVAGESDNPRVMPVTALENLRSALHQYAARFGGNPVGDNAEITAALTGQNRRQQVFATSDDGLRTDGHGRLIDNWGTPYFFHQLSRTETEIRSAGPDKRMWTSDDLVMK